MEERQPPMNRRRLQGGAELTAEVNANGSIRRLSHKGVMINLFLASEMEVGPADIYLRRSTARAEGLACLASIRKIVRCDDRSMTLEGEWRGVRLSPVLRPRPIRRRLVLASGLGKSRRQTTRALDLIYVQDLGLADYGAVRSNEYYVSQYVDHSPLSHPDQGVVVASRQNQRVDGRNPWCVIGSLERGVSFATDALQVHRLSTRAGESPEALTRGLPGKRLQHEHSVAAIQDAPFRLAPGERVERGFFGWFEQDHPAATSPSDLAFVDRALASPEASFALPPRAGGASASTPPSLFASTPLFDALELTEAEIAELFGGNLREAEREKNGRLLSFFCGERSHVALKAKELAALRPHGHILHTGGGLVADEAALTSTVWMCGVFHSMLTQGHVDANRLLSANRSYLGLFRAHGQRLFLDIGEGWRLFDEPSAFEMTPQACRWLYKHDQGLIQVEKSGADREPRADLVGRRALRSVAALSPVEPHRSRRRRRRRERGAAACSGRPKHFHAPCRRQRAGDSFPDGGSSSSCCRERPSKRSPATRRSFPMASPGISCVPGGSPRQMDRRFRIEKGASCRKAARRGQRPLAFGMRVAWAADASAGGEFCPGTRRGWLKSCLGSRTKCARP